MVCGSDSAREGLLAGCVGVGEERQGVLGLGLLLQRVLPRREELVERAVPMQDRPSGIKIPYKPDLVTVGRREAPGSAR